MDLWKSFRVPDPTTQRATREALRAKQLFRLSRLAAEAVLAGILQDGPAPGALLPGHLEEAAAAVLALPAEGPYLVAVFRPDLLELRVAPQALAASDVHEPAHRHLAPEAAAATDHGDVVHVERDRPSGQPSLLPLLARRARVLHRLERLDDHGVAALAAHDPGCLPEEGAVPVEVLDRPLRPADRALVLEELEGLILGGGAPCGP
mmetsp:Transcript_69892/g.216105  ORF Transcript_69892/g.216105 Transcript_69892/m.216105 type:complete len:206 (-) Transcript_69892:53-670(-)